MNPKKSLKNNCLQLAGEMLCAAANLHMGPHDLFRASILVKRAGEIGMCSGGENVFLGKYAGVVYLWSDNYSFRLFMPEGKSKAEDIMACSVSPSYAAVPPICAADKSIAALEKWGRSLGEEDRARNERMSIARRGIK